MKNPITFKLAFIVLIVLATQCVFSQTKQIKGVIVNSDKVPLSGIRVQVEGTEISVKSASDGSFQLTVPDSIKTIQFSDFKEMKIDEVIVSNGSLYNYSYTQRDKLLRSFSK